MNRDQKAAVIEEIAANISESQAIFAVDYRGITVEQAKELRGRLRAADATLRVVKNSLTERAADKVGAEQLKELLAGPTALTFVRGDSAAAAKSLADFARVTHLLAFKGGVMDGASLSAAEITTISRLPSREVLYGQLVGLIATPLSGLVRTLNALVGGLALQLGAILEQRGGVMPVAGEAPPAEPQAGEADGGEPAGGALAESAGDATASETPAAEELDEGPADAGTEESEEESAPEASGTDDQKENE